MASQTRTLVSVAEYLATIYEPDAEYIDGRIIGRNVGQKKHSLLQAALTSYFYARRAELGINVFPEQRVRIGPDRYRIPDVAVVRVPEPEEEVFATPTLLCIEILSPDDRASEMLAKVQEYLDWGVEYVWLVDPAMKTGWSYMRTGAIEWAENGVLSRPFEVNLREI